MNVQGRINRESVGPPVESVVRRRVGGQVDKLNAFLQGQLPDAPVRDVGSALWMVGGRGDGSEYEVIGGALFRPPLDHSPQVDKRFRVPSPVPAIVGACGNVNVIGLSAESGEHHAGRSSSDCAIHYSKTSSFEHPGKLRRVVGSVDGCTGYQFRPSVAVIGIGVTEEKNRETELEQHNTQAKEQWHF